MDSQAFSNLKKNIHYTYVNPAFLPIICIGIFYYDKTKINREHILQVF